MLHILRMLQKCNTGRIWVKAYVTTHKFDIICLSETYLDSSIPTNNDILDIDG